MKYTYLLLLLFVFNGCDLLETQEEKNQKIENQKVAFEKKVAQTKEIQLKKLSAQTQKELAILESKKELANIEKEKELEKIKLQTELEKQKIVLDMEKEKAIFEQKMSQNEQINNMELKRYLVLVFGLFVLVGSFFIFYYFKKRREDKLRAYNDNLQKYFNQKENEARVKIAEKMLDTIASGHLDKAQENQLISAFKGESNGEYQQQLIEDKSDDIDITDDVELIEKPTN